ncbi:type I restriction enzyme EcoKI M protein [Perkinsela sp. CCAP 1560/4]|nr:type I restriction enzyme EcoKI M protein [Perkinsela sp. CCAP 1560/4]|eukprot:KNH08669.1 type I restriction enzyme EcoKI M protein [Perkinsela sp. CCAP 1560/4]
MKNHDIPIMKSYLSKLQAYLAGARPDGVVCTKSSERDESRGDDMSPTDSTEQSRDAQPEVHAILSTSDSGSGDAPDTQISLDVAEPELDADSLSKRKSASAFVSEDGIDSPHQTPTGQSFEALCKKCIPSYKLGHKAKRKTQSFLQFLQHKTTTTGPQSSQRADSVRASRDLSRLSSYLTRWAGRRPSPLPSDVFLSVIRGDRGFGPDEEEVNLMRNVNVALHLTPSSRKNGRGQPSLMPSIPSRPMSREFRLQCQLLLEEIAACLHLRKGEHSPHSPPPPSEKVRTKRKTPSKNPEPIEMFSFLSETAKEIYKRHYAARLYDESHYSATQDPHFVPPSGKASKKSASCAAGADECQTESFVFIVPNNLKKFIEWINPGSYTIFLLHWVLFVAITAIGKGKGIQFSKLIPRGFLNAAKAWNVSSRSHLHKIKAELNAKPLDTNALDALLAVFPQSILILKQILACAALYHEAEKLSQIITNLHEHKHIESREDFADTQSLLETHEKDVQSLILGKSHSRLSARIAAENPLEVYKDVPSRYTAEDFSPAVLHAIEARRKLHKMEEKLEQMETVRENDYLRGARDVDEITAYSRNEELAIGCPDITTRVLNGLHGATKGDFRRCDLSLGALDARICTLQIVDFDKRQPHIDLKQGGRQSSKEDVPWDAVGNSSANEQANFIRSFYNRFDKCGFASLVLRKGVLPRVRQE